MPIFTNQPHNPIPYIPICLSTSYPCIPTYPPVPGPKIPTYPLNPYTLNFESYIYFLTLITLLFLLCQIALWSVTMTCEASVEFNVNRRHIRMNR